MGLVLLCPDADFLGVRMSRSNKRAAKLVRRDTLDHFPLNEAKQAIENRLLLGREEFLRPEALDHYAATRANDLRLTSLRLGGG